MIAHRTNRLLLRSLARPLSSLAIPKEHRIAGTGTVDKHRPNFDAKQCRPHKNKTVPELLQSLLVFQMIQLPPLVQHGEAIVGTMRSVLGDTITDSLIRHTFFPQFCGGENQSQIVDKMSELKGLGINSILDYAAEDEGPGPTCSTGTGTTVNRSAINQPAREYDYESEEICDGHVETFRRCIQTVHDAGNGRQFAAMKVTGLGNPKLLLKMSTAVRHIQATVNFHDTNKKGHLNKAEILKVARSLSGDNDMIARLVDHLDPCTQKVDYVDLSAAAFALDFSSGPSTTFADIIPDSLKFTTEEIDLIHTLRARANTIAQEAADLNVSLLIDAEQSWFQPAIDVISLGLQQTYNSVETTTKPIIYTTHQCYLKDSLDRLQVDVKRSQRLSYHFGSKLVRGAYMHRERSRASEKGYASPIHDTVQDTHDCYNGALEYLLRQAKITDFPTIEVMCASHNRESIEFAIELCNELGLSALSNDNLSFAQLFGMSDDLTIPLGERGYNVYKYLPYGEIKEVIPYMLRRAQENGDVLGKSKYEMKLVVDELKERMKM
mmetsp:Transcript_9518/g.14355  ORF Transcript_9518/g.14355 Transcript_9518/m.14355 type:complete len:550 (-) Transcript_9518:1459-3108(-)